MDRDAVAKLVIQAVLDVQVTSGRSVADISGRTKPIEDLAGFDSYNGLEASMILSHLLTYEVSDDNLFTADDNLRALSITEITSNLYEVLQNQSSDQ